MLYNSTQPNPTTLYERVWLGQKPIWFDPIPGQPDRTGPDTLIHLPTVVQEDVGCGCHLEVYLFSWNA
ncbi:hypothetical protein H5410_043755 [Solanum commersonii]|uniref:Uncharacterized protein n=1 Tax=Solanum commersonii TaxID=4109 RepID=A0A9J5XYG4_SOLCO|nr:hypothetical protein H5410_043755 [Solanum commersonii]